MSASSYFLVSAKQAICRPSGGQFLRVASQSSSLRPLQSSNVRPFSGSSIQRVADEHTPDGTKPTSELPNHGDGSISGHKKGDSQHSTRKASNDPHDPVSEGSKLGMEAKNKGEGGNATEERDSAGGVASAKRDHPAAPDPAIGMQDERGGRGA